MQLARLTIRLIVEGDSVMASIGAVTGREARVHIVDALSAVGFSTGAECPCEGARSRVGALRALVEEYSNDQQRPFTTPCFNALSEGFYRILVAEPLKRAGANQLPESLVLQVPQELAGISFGTLRLDRATPLSARTTLHVQLPGLRGPSPTNQRPSPHVRLLFLGASTFAAPWGALPQVELERRGIRAAYPAERYSEIWGNEFTQRSLDGFEASGFAGPTHGEVVHVAAHGDDRAIIAADGSRIDLRTFSQWISRRPDVRLIFFNACDLAEHRPGTRSFAHGLYEATGIPIIAPSWTMDDEFGSKFAIAFHQALRRTVGAWRRAFRETVESYARDPDFRHPVFWGAFTTLGL